MHFAFVSFSDCNDEEEFAYPRSKTLCCQVQLTEMKYFNYQQNDFMSQMIPNDNVVSPTTF